MERPFIKTLVRIGTSAIFFVESACTVVTPRSGSGDNGPENSNSTHTFLATPTPSLTPFQPLLPAERQTLQTLSATVEPSPTPFDPFPYLTEGGIDFAEGSPEIDIIFDIISANEDISIPGIPINFNPNYPDSKADPRYGPGKGTAFITPTKSGNLIYETDSGWDDNERLPAEWIRAFLEGYFPYLDENERSDRITQLINALVSLHQEGTVEDYEVLNVVRVLETSLGEYQEQDLKSIDEYLAKLFPETAEHLNDGVKNIYLILCGWQLPEDELPEDLPGDYSKHLATRYIVILGPKR